MKWGCWNIGKMALDKKYLKNLGNDYHYPRSTYVVLYSLVFCCFVSKQWSLVAW